MTADMQSAWNAAIAECLNGHECCTYGGPSPNHGYWLADTECLHDHHGCCAWCHTESITRFVGWAEDGVSIYAVPACQEHADAWVVDHPEWQRYDPPDRGNNIRPAPSPQTVKEYAMTEDQINDLLIRHANGLSLREMIREVERICTERIQATANRHPEH
jgi:hypothetical protein